MNLKKIFKNIILLIVFFFNLFPVNFVFLPVSTAKLSMITGIICCLIDFDTKKNRKECFLLSLCLLPILFVILVSSCINSYIELDLFSNGLSILYYIISFYTFKFCAKLLKIELDFCVISKIFISCCLIQQTIAILSFFYKDFDSFLLGLQRFDSIELAALTRTYGMQLRGFGSKFFSSGIINSVCLCLISRQMIRDGITRICSFFYAFSYLYILVSGLMMARTIMIGFVVSIIYIILKGIKYIKRIIFPFIFAEFFIGCILLIFYFYDANKYETLFNFGFEVFINIAEGKGIQSRSTNKMLTMYSFPKYDEYKTWIIGDSKLFTQNRSGYYKGTDIGYCRYIYSIGVIGLIIAIVSQFIYIFGIIYPKKRNDIVLFIMFFLMFIIFNLKGLSNMSLYLAPFYLLKREDN